MKFLHIGDLHIGKTLNGRSLLEDQRYILNEIIELMITNDCSNIILAGDVYDRSVPSSDAVEVFNDFLDALIIKHHFKVFMISGNHDSSERLGFTSSILKYSGLYIETHLQDYINHVDTGDVCVYMLPYFNPAATSYESAPEAIKELIKNSKLDKTKVNILIYHGSVSGSTELIRCDSETSINIGGMDSISSNLFKDFDYVALGHIHTPQKVGSNKIRYSGSILMYSESEISTPKSCVLIDVKAKDDISINLLSLTPLHNMIKIEDSFDNILKDTYPSTPDYVYFELTDRSLVLDAMARLKIKFPNAIAMRYKELEKENKINNKVEGFNKLSIDEQFKEFYHEITGDEISESKLNIMKDIIKEVTHETN